MSARVCVVGALHRDIVVRAARFPAPGETVSGSGLGYHPGGKGANQAVAASRMGARVALVGAVGDDEAGSALRVLLAAEGIDLDHLVTAARAPTGVGVITVGPDGDNTIVVAPGADDELAPEHVEEASGAIADADVLLVQGELRPATTQRAVELARKGHTAVVHNASPVTAHAAALFAKVDTLVVNRCEAAQLVGDGERAIAPAGLARRLASLGPACVVVTLGAEGALYFDGETLEHVAAFPVDAVDATGAGDAFAAALAVFRAEQVRMKDAVRLACAAGALASTVQGAITGLPTREAIEGLAQRARLQYR